jgi:hypothetical protein
MINPEEVISEIEDRLADGYVSRDQRDEIVGYVQDLANALEKAETERDALQRSEGDEHCARYRVSRVRRLIDERIDFRQEVKDLRQQVKDLQAEINTERATVSDLRKRVRISRMGIK